MIKLFIGTKELAVRWGVTLKILRQWRWRKKGPNFSIIGGRILYKIEDIEKFEKTMGDINDKPDEEDKDDEKLDPITKRSK